MGENHRRNPNTECIICTKPVYKRPWEIQRNEGRVYCSTACYALASRKEKPCVVCGERIMAQFNKKTCSRSCANRHRAGIHYKSKGSGRHDKVVTARLLKIRLMELRGEICERCDYARPEILQVHHKDRNRNNNDLSNLELICPNCHCEEHYLEKSWLKTEK